MNKYRPFLIIALVFLAVILGGVFMLRSDGNDHDSDGSSSPEPTAKVPADTVVTLEEFGDYQCPSCGMLHPSLKKLKEEFGPNLNFVFRNLPLTSVHKNALAAAQAGEAARMQNRFWEMHDLLYENQDLWKEDINPRTIFIKFASDLGVNTWQFTRDMDGEQVKARIQADLDAAAELSINGTPTVLVDGRQMRLEMTTPEGIRKAIEAKLGRKQTPTP